MGNLADSTGQASAESDDPVLLASALRERKNRIETIAGGKVRTASLFAGDEASDGRGPKFKAMMSGKSPNRKPPDPRGERLSPMNEWTPSDTNADRWNRRT